MNKYQSGDYALNKHSEGIVYRFADGIVEVTLTDFLADNPGKTEDDFQKLKELSDADYLERDRSEHRQTWKNTTLDDRTETVCISVPSAETLVVDALEEALQQSSRVETARNALSMLTDIQKRRYLLRVVKRLTTREIAALERVSHVAVVYSLEAAEKRIKKYFSNL